MSILLKTAGAMLAIYLLIVLAAWLGQRRLMYVPNPSRVAPANAGLAGVAEQELAAPDGARLVAWDLPARAGMPTILYFHGNAGSLASRAERIRRYASTGVGVHMMSYRGYSGSTGSPSETAILADARLAYQALIRRGIGAADIVLYGESLGSAVAVQLAAEHPVGAVVLDAPFTSMADVAALAYPFLPVRPLLADRYESIRHIPRVRAPVLVLHGAHDSIVPLAMGQALHAAANPPKEIVVFPRGGHSDLDDHGAVETVVRWLAGHRRAR